MAHKAEDGALNDINSPLPPCSQCGFEHSYEDGALLVCPACAHEWSVDPAFTNERVYKDVNGNLLNEGDWVTIIKDLKVKGTSKVAKVGTKVRINRLIDEDHDIDCKIDGIGAMKLKTMFVKKA